MARRGQSSTNTTVPDEVAAIRAAIKECMDQVDEVGRTVGGAKYGIYCFYDYDDEPIYVGQTAESLRQRIGRHLTNQRTDAVAMNVLDPFEVLTVEMYPLWYLASPEYESMTGGKRKLNDKGRDVLNRAEFSVYQRALMQSRFHSVLNEADMLASETVGLPTSYRGRIVPDEVYRLRRHPDIRIARRAMTIANLARVISERDVSAGLRRTLHTQSLRLEYLSRTRLDEFGGVFPVEAGTETGDASDEF